MAVEIDSLTIEIEATSEKAAASINQLTESLTRLKAAAKNGAGLGTASKKLKEIASTSDGVNGVTNKMKELTEETRKLGKSSSGLNSFTQKAGKLALFGISLYRVVDYMSDCVNSINDYVETVNLFQVSMGEFYDEAFEYAQLVNEKLGVDPAQWMRNQGVFMSMAKGFGLANQQAYELSESLTELSYDIASLYNEDVETAARRLQSALAGEIEPIRRLGISISQATLQEYAMSKGIKENVSQMTEQEKALLRSMKLIEGADTIGAVGDFVKTLESPANSMRILKQQITEMGRAIGSVLLPVIIQLLPYLQAFISHITDAISALATFVGFTIPDWGSQDWGDGAVGDLNSGLEGAVDSAKELKKTLLGIDELTILSEPKAAADAGGSSGWVNDINIPNLWDKAQIEKISTKANEIKKELQPLFDAVVAIGVAIAGWKISTELYKALKDLKSLAIGLVISGVTLEYSGLVNIFSGKGTLKDYLLAFLGAALGVGGSLLLLGTGPTGWIVGGLVVTFTALIAWQTSKKQQYENSKFHQEILELRDKIAAFEEVTKQVKVEIELIYEDYDAVGKEYDSYLEIVDRLFELEAIPEKTAGQLGLMKEYVNILNGLNIDGLELHFNELTGEISKSKDEVYNLINAMKAKALQDAAYDSLVALYKKQLQYQQEGEELKEALAAAEAKKEEAQAYYDHLMEIVNDAASMDPLGVNALLTSMSYADEFDKALQMLAEANTVYEETNSDWAEFEATMGEITDAIAFFEGKLEDAAATAQTTASKMSGAFDAVTTSIETARKSLLNFGEGNLSLKFSSKQAVAYASGGFPEEGEMFLARESGPELVGRIGNKTAVANNDQIVSGIASGVENANQGVITAIYSMARSIVTAVENSGDTYLDGRKVSLEVATVQGRQSRIYGR